MRIVVDDNGYVYATGRHYGPDFNGPTYTNADILTIKLDTAGNLIWSHRFNDQGNNSGEVGYGLHVSSDGHVLVSGSASGPIPSWNLSYLAILLSPNGDQITTVTFDGSSDHECAWSIVGGANDMYLTGQSIDGVGFGHTVTQRYALPTSTGSAQDSGLNIIATPNPFVERTTLRFPYTLSSGSVLEVFDVRGTIVGKWPVEGSKNIEIRSEVFRGSGVYMARIVTNGIPGETTRLIRMHE
ncbi:MAG: T9SS type A sorting domain-containing protein [Flavobacteriales bacterium]